MSSAFKLAIIDFSSYVFPAVRRKTSPRGERVNITRANCARSRQAAKEKSKNCTVVSPAPLYIFPDDLILSGAKMVNGIGERYRGDSDGRLSSEVKVTRSLKPACDSSRSISSRTCRNNELMNIDRAIVRYEQNLRFSLLIFLFLIHAIYATLKLRQ